MLPNSGSTLATHPELSPDGTTLANVETTQGGTDYDVTTGSIVLRSFDDASNTFGASHVLVPMRERVELLSVVVAGRPVDLVHAHERQLVLRTRRRSVGRQGRRLGAADPAPTRHHDDQHELVGAVDAVPAELRTNHETVMYITFSSERVSVSGR